MRKTSISVTCWKFTADENLSLKKPLTCQLSIPKMKIRGTSSYNNTTAYITRKPYCDKRKNWKAPVPETERKLKKKKKVR